MRPHFILIVAIFIFSACGKDYHSLKSASVKTVKPASASVTKTTSKDKAKPVSDTGGNKCSGGDDLPSARYSWDTKMVLW